MAQSAAFKKRRLEDKAAGKPKKKVRHQRVIDYHSGSEDELPPTAEAVATGPNSQPVSTTKPVPKSAPKPAPKPILKPAREEIEEEESSASTSAAESGDETDEDSDASMEEEDDDDEGDGQIGNRKKKLPKRKDPNAFATSISAILGSKLSAAKRPDPVLSRSAAAAAVSAEVADEKLSLKAKKAVRDEKRAALDTGRVKDVLAEIEIEGSSILEKERLLRKTAQRGVVRLSNAVRAAQVQAENARKETRTMVGDKGRRERVDEMSKEGFLSLIKGKSA